MIDSLCYYAGADGSLLQRNQLGTEVLVVSPATSGPRWATLVLDILDDADAARLQQIATLRMTMGGRTDSTEVVGQYVGVMEKKWSIAAIQKKHGKPDKVEVATRDEQGGKVNVQRYIYGSFIIETMKDSDEVSWLYAPCGDWADGIRKVATSAIQKATITREK
jgi:hypothetical protein